MLNNEDIYIEHYEISLDDVERRGGWMIGENDSMQKVDGGG